LHIREYLLIFVGDQRPEALPDLDLSYAGGGKGCRFESSTAPVIEDAL